MTWLETWLSHIPLSRLAALVALLFCSSYAAASETAFFSLNRFQLRRLRERSKASYERVRALLARPSRLLVLILLINELVNLSFSTISTETTERILVATLGVEPSWYVTTFVSMAVSIPILVFFGEITPKIIATKMNLLVAVVNSVSLRWLQAALFPLLWVIDRSIGVLLRALKAEGKDYLSKTMSVLSEDDVVVLMNEGHREGSVDPHERKLITNVFEFDDSTVSEVLTPIANVFCISATAKIGEVLPEIKSQKYSRIPVYHRNRRNIVGVLYVKDLLSLGTHPELADTEVRALMTRALFVSPNTRLSVLFRRFKESKTHMAIVGNLDHEYSRARHDSDMTDEEALGVVTMEDLLECIFGEFTEEGGTR